MLTALLDRLHISTRRIGGVRYLRIGRFNINLSRSSAGYRSLHAPPAPKPERKRGAGVCTLPPASDPASMEAPR